jgi:hypothetical protein
VDELCVNRFRASAWRTMAREKEVTEQTVIGCCVAKGIVEQMVHRAKRRAVSTVKQIECQGLTACSHCSYVLAFGYFRGAASCQIERLGRALCDSTLIAPSLHTLFSYVVDI